jgi:hypothetical protein
VSAPTETNLVAAVRAELHRPLDRGR